MNGLEKWMRANNTCPAEISTLIAASGLNPDDMLGAEKDAEELSGGKSTALTAMLERGRNGEMIVNLATFAQCAETDLAAVVKAVNDNGDFGAESVVRETDGTPAGIKSNALPKLMETLNIGLPAADTESAEPAEDSCSHTPDEPADNNESAGEQPGDNGDAPTDGNTDEKTPAPAGKGKGRGKGKPAEPTFVMAPRRKTKYSINKATANELFRCGEMPFDGVGLRKFLLSLPEYKPQDVALMSDAKVNEIIEKNFVAVKLGDGAILMSSSSWLSMVNVLTANDAYYIPAEQAEETEE